MCSNLWIKADTIDDKMLLNITYTIEYKIYLYIICSVKMSRKGIKKIFEIFSI